MTTYHLKEGNGGEEVSTEISEDDKRRHTA